MDLYIVIHRYDYDGSSLNTYLVKCDHWPDENEVIKACNIDYNGDSDLHESIDIEQTTITKIQGN